MHHSFSSESFLKPSKLVRSPQAQHRFQNDITVPKDYFNQKVLFDQTSNQSPQKSNLSVHSISKLKKKIKQIKSALKIAEQHNEQLHLKLTQQKKYFLDQKKYLEIQVSKFKSLYQMLIQNYETRQLELKHAKKIIKKLEKQDSKTISQINANNCQSRANLSPSKYRTQEDQNLVKLKEMLTQQQVNLQHSIHENKLLREQVVLKNKKLSEYQILLSTYQSEERISRLSPKNNKQVLQLSSKVQSLEQESHKLRKEKQITLTKIRRLQVEVQSSKNFKESIEREDTQLKRQNQQLKLQVMMKERIINQIKDENAESKWKLLYEETSQKYNQLLRFSYQIQKDFERELHTMAKQMTRREIVKNAENS